MQQVEKAPKRVRRSRGWAGGAPMKALRSSLPLVSPSLALGTLRCRKLKVANHGKLPTLAFGARRQQPRAMRIEGVMMRACGAL